MAIDLSEESCHWIIALPARTAVGHMSRALNILPKDVYECLPPFKTQCLKFIPLGPKGYWNNGQIRYLTRFGEATFTRYSYSTAIESAEDWMKNWVFEEKGILVS
ncbi:predicted protein [Coccidioides posadasii str. Silveira]|uniref:Predicted protein n=1 Tax=Coccidioides posadasii (strain RMSCC 757 / Silveira) TaxID=443226 RepID=E9DDZ3_COCPS|nr:predicted protein [Coccidioides posadasii str. Silveira]